MASPMFALRMAKDYLSHRLSTTKRRVRRQASRPRRMSVEPLEERALLSVVAGTVYEDLDGDGLRGAGEPGMTGVTVYLDANDNAVLDAGELTQVTGDDGSYAFTDLAAGNYVVREVVPATYRQTAPASDSGRLFGVNYVTNRIVELDPTTGATLNQFAAPTVASTYTTSMGLAFDGQRLYFLSDLNDTLYQLDPDHGDILAQTVLPSGQYDGLAVQDGYVSAMESAADQIFVVDPTTGVVVDTISTGAANPGWSFQGGLGEIDGPNALIATSGDSTQVAFLDPATGVITGTFDNQLPSATDLSATAIGQEIYLGFSNGFIRVYDRAGVVQRTFPTNFVMAGLAGYGADGAHRVALGPSETRSDLDFGNLSILGEIRGTKYEDLDGDGQRDAGEPALAGTTVYLDANYNAVFDAGELTQITAADGSYAFTGLVPGNYVVREVVPPGYRQTAPASRPARLFAVHESNTTILELHPTTGDTLNQFPTPVGNPYSNAMGLAFDGQYLYFLTVVDSTLYQLDPDTGAVLNSSALPHAGYDGLAILDGCVYATDLDLDRIRVIDPSTGEVVRTISPGTVNPGENFLGALGEIAAPNALVATLSNSNDAVFLNPLTGQITGRFNTGVTAGEAGATAIGQEIYLGFNDDKIRVYSRTGTLQRTLTMNFTTTALAGDGGCDAHSITLAPSQVRTGVDFGDQSLRGDIQGSVYLDADGDGTRDPEETPHAGVTVYLDLNDNGQQDAGEPAQTTDSNGAYLFTGLLSDTYVIREVIPTDFQQTSPGIGDDLYYGSTYASNQWQLVQINGRTGQVTRIGSPQSVPLRGVVTTGDGQMYAVSGNVASGIGNNNFYSVNRTTGAPTLIGSAGCFVGSALTYDPATDTIYGMGKTSSSDTVWRLLVIDRRTGQATPIGDGTSGLNNLSGMVFDSQQNRVLVYDYTDGEIYAFDPLTGAATLAVDLNVVNVSCMACDGQFAVFGASSSGLIFFDTTNGTFVGTRSLSESLMIDSLERIPRVPYGQRVFVGAATTVTAADFGNQSALSTVQGTVFLDADGDGTRDPEETAHAGVTVYVDLNDNSQPDAGEPVQVTDANGAYQFTDVRPGNYVIREVVSADFQQTSPGIGDDVYYGSAYASGQWQLVRINGRTGQVTRIGSPQSLALRGVVITGDGQMYAVSGNVASGSGNNNFYSLNPSTGAPTMVGFTGYFVGSALTYDPATDTIYGMGKTSSSDTMWRLLVIDRRTGRATAIGEGTSGLNNLSGMVFDSQQNRVLVYDYTDGEIYAFDPLTGTATLAVDLNVVNVSCMASDGQFAVFGASSSGLIFFDTTNGTFVGTRSLSESLMIDSLERIPRVPYGQRVFVGAATTVTAADFGNQSALSTVQGTVFLDADGDGTRDPEETAHAGVSVYLDLNDNSQQDAGEPVQVTDANGAYQFTDVRPGNYVIREVVSADFQQTSPGIGDDVYYGTAWANSQWQLVRINGTTRQVTRIGSPQSLALRGAVTANDGQMYGISGNGNNNFFSVNPSTGEPTVIGFTGYFLGNGLTYDRATETIYGIGKTTSADTVWRLLVIDRRTGRATALGDGTAALGTPGGMAFDTQQNRVLVYDTDGEFYAFDPATGTPSLAARFPSPAAFSNLAWDGPYAVFGSSTSGLVYFNMATSTVVANLPLSEPLSMDSLERIPRVAYGQRLFVGAGTTVTAADFGNRSALSTVQGTVFLDADGDGTRDPEETAHAGVTVYVDLNDNSQPDAGEPVQITDANGEYQFTDVLPGNYVIREVVSADFQQTSPGVGDDIYYGSAYANNQWQLVRINGTTRQVTRIGSPQSLAMRGVVMTNDGQVYAIIGSYSGSSSNNNFFSLNPTTGAPTMIGFTGYFLGNGLTYDRATDTIYGIGKASSSDTIWRLLVIDRRTGRGTALGDGTAALGTPGGMAFDTQQNQVLVYDTDGEFYAFDPVTGTPTLAARFPSPVAFSNLAWDGPYAVFESSTSGLVYFNMAASTVVANLPLSESLSMDSLERIPRVPYGQRLFVGPATTVTAADFGNQSALSTVQGTVFLDADGDGTRDPEETAHAGVTVYVDLNDNSQPDAGEPTQITDANGAYQFTDVRPGNYVIREVVSADFQQTSPGIGDDVYYGSIWANNQWQLARINGTTRQVTRIGSPQTVPLRGVVQTNDGQMYAISGNVSGPSNNNFFSVNPTTGAATVIGFTGYYIGGSLTYDPATDAIYGLGKTSSSDTFWRLLVIDRRTGRATAVGSGTANLGSPAGMAFDSQQNRVLVYDSADGELYAFDPATGTATLAARYSSATGYPSLAWDGQYAVFETTTAGLIYFNMAAATVVGNLPLSEAVYMDSLERIPRVAYGQRVFVGPATTVTAADFGNRNVLGAIQGTVFVDADNDGIRDPEEIAHAGVTVYLDLNDNSQLDAGEPTQTTDSSGAYQFTGVRPGTYAVREVAPLDFEQTSPGVGADTYYGSAYANSQWQLVQINGETGQVMRIGSAQSTPLRGLVSTNDGRIYGVDGGSNSSLYSVDPATGAATRVGITLYHMAYALTYDPATDTIYGLGRTSPSDTLWRLLVIDRNTGRPTAIGPGTTGLNGPSAMAFDSEQGRVLVYDNGDGELYAFDPATGTATLATTVSARPNSWCLANDGTSAVFQVANSSTMLFVNSATGAITSQLTLSEPLAIDSLECIRKTPYGQRVVVAPTATVTGADFGNRSVLGDIQGAVFVDVDGDSVRDAGEAGQAGVTVFVDLNNNAQWDPDEPVQTTDANGEYLFADFRPGHYVVREILPEGYQQSPSQFSSDAYYGSAYNGSGQTQMVVIDPATGNAHTLGGLMGTALDGLVVTHDGSIYGMNGADSSLYAVDPTTGLATKIGPSGFELGYGLAYDRATDTIYGIGRTGPSDPVMRLMVFDRTTGAATAIGPGIRGMNATSSMAFDIPNGRIIAFDNRDDEYYAFDTAGRATRLSVAASPVESWASAHNGQSLVQADSTGFYLNYVDPATGAQVGQLAVHPGFRLGALDFVRAAFVTREVTLPVAGHLNVVGFGNNGLPTAEAGGPYSVAEGSTISLDASLSSDPEGVPLAYLWDLDGDGLFGETGTAAARGDEVGAQPVFSAAALDGPASLDVALRVVDTAGFVAEDTASIEVTNVSPDCGVSGPADGVTGQVLTFTLAANDPSRADQAAGFVYTVNWGDGSVDTLARTPNNGTGLEIVHAYAHAGQYTVTVNATDKDGAVSDPATTTVLVNKADTVTTLSSSADTAVYGDSLVFTAYVGVAAPGAGSPTGTVLFYDGDVLLDSEMLNGTGIAVSDAIAGLSAGDHLITVSYLGDEDFASSVSSVMTITITPAAVTVTADAQSKTYGDPDPTLTYQITSGSLVGNDTFSGELTRVAGEDVGSYAIEQGSLALSSNYTLTYVGADLTITQRAVTVTADAQSKIYGDADPALTYQITSGSLAFNDGFTGALARVAGEDVGSYAIEQGTLALSSNYTLTYVGADLAITQRAVTVTADAQSKIYGDADPALTYQITSGSLAFSDGFTGELTRVAGEDVGSYAIEQGSLALSANYTLTYVGADLTITQRAASVTPNSASKHYGESDPLLTGTLSGFLAADGVTATYTRAPGETVGTYLISATLAPAEVLDNYSITYNTANFTITTVEGSIFVLNPTVSGALTMSGNAHLDTDATLFVDSTSSSAISASGNAIVTADDGVLVVGGVRATGNAHVTRTGTPGATVDPYSGLVAPTASGTVLSVNLSGNSTQTINPGTYSQIKVSGNGRLTFNPGVYVIAGGGISITGNAIVTGSNVMLYNAGSNVLGGGGTPTYGGIAIGGNGNVQLTAPNTGPYAGVLIFQARDNTRAMSMGDNTITGFTGMIYAPSALLAMSGNAQLRNQVSIVVDRLQISGNGSSALAIDELAVGTGLVAGELLATDLYLYVDDSCGTLTSDALSRLDETIAGLNALLASSNVSITETSDSSVANLVLDTATTSAAGGYAEGVLGCFTTLGEITLIQGWDWYTGADPAAISAGQYDFQSIVTHELGHALGLGHSEDTASAMNATLQSGAVRRTITVADLNLQAGGGSVEALHAATIQAMAAEAVVLPAPSGSEAPDLLPMASSDEVRLMNQTTGALGSSAARLDSQAVGAVLAADGGLASSSLQPAKSGSAWLDEQAALDPWSREAVDLTLCGAANSSRDWLRFYQ